MKDPILIVGTARSGTSMTAGVIETCGAYGGNTVGPRSTNKKGMFENFDIVKGIVKPYLKEHGWDRRCQNPLPKIFDVRTTVTEELASNWKKAVLHVMRRHGYRDGPWYYKDPKACLIWPLWHAAFPNAKWIIVRRDAEDIVRSCLRTNFMRAYKDRSGWLFWVSVHEKRFEEMVNEGIVFAEVWPQKMINRDFTEIQIAVNNLGLTWKEDEVKAFIEPKLWNKGIGRHGKSGN